jgi:hypothetical protein
MALRTLLCVLMCWPTRQVTLPATFEVCLLKAGTDVTKRNSCMNRAVDYGQTQNVSAMNVMSHSEHNGGAQVLGIKHDALGAGTEKRYCAGIRLSGLPSLSGIYQRVSRYPPHGRQAVYSRREQPRLQLFYSKEHAMWMVSPSAFHKPFLACTRRIPPHEAAPWYTFANNAMLVNFEIESHCIEAKALVTQAPSQYPTAPMLRDFLEELSVAPSSMPTGEPTGNPSGPPTLCPTAVPTSAPTSLPTNAPSYQPTTAFPTAVPTEIPTMPSASPSACPSSHPTTASPSNVPTPSPTTHGCPHGMHYCWKQRHLFGDAMSYGTAKCVPDAMSMLEEFVARSTVIRSLG